MRVGLLRIVKPDGLVKDLRLIVSSSTDLLTFELEPGDTVLDCFASTLSGRRRTSTSLDEVFSTIAESRDLDEIRKGNLFQ